MNVVKDEIMEELIISNENFEKYFNKRKWITKEEYEKYLQIKITIKNFCAKMLKILDLYGTWHEWKYEKINQSKFIKG